MGQEGAQAAGRGETGADILEGGITEQSQEQSGQSRRTGGMARHVDSGSGLEGHVLGG